MLSSYTLLRNTISQAVQKPSDARQAEEASADSTCWGTASELPEA